MPTFLRLVLACTCTLSFGLLILAHRAWGGDAGAAYVLATCTVDLFQPESFTFDPAEGKVLKMPRPAEGAKNLYHLKIKEGTIDADGPVEIKMEPLGSTAVGIRITATDVHGNAIRDAQYKKKMKLTMSRNGCKGSNSNTYVALKNEATGEWEPQKREWDWSLNLTSAELEHLSAYGLAVPADERF